MRPCLYRSCLIEMSDPVPEPVASSAEAAAGSDAAGEKKEKIRRFTTHAFRKTPTGGHGHVLAWGWLFKQVSTA